jgi:hypothetical protein
MKKISTLLLNCLWFAHSYVVSFPWRYSRRRIKQTQAKLLRSILNKNAGTAFGISHDFKTIKDVDDFRLRVPVRSYEEFEAAIGKMVSGKDDVLTTERIEMFGLSSGSTNASKMIPYTKGLVREFRRGIGAWLYFLFRKYPGALRGKAYWSVTPVGQEKKYSSSGVPIGFDDEGIYFDRLSRWILGKVLIVPSEVSIVRDVDAFRYLTLLFLLKEKNLSWISIWNPTFAILFLEPLRAQMSNLIGDIRNGTLSVELDDPSLEIKLRLKLGSDSKRADELEKIHKRDSKNLYEEIWPHLRLISCWAHGQAEHAVEKLQHYFPKVEIQPKGLVATEAFVSFPYWKDTSALSTTSHFFEFEESVSKYIFLAHELKRGLLYSVIITTSGGLYRYRLNDLIRVDGFTGQCPLIVFVGKQDRVVDIFGEKLNEAFVKKVVTDSLSTSGLNPDFWMMAPQNEKTTALPYVLFIKSNKGETAELLKLGELIENGLRENFHYDYCRRLGQLDQCKVFLIKFESSPDEIYLKTCAELGQRLGDIKPAKLHTYMNWAEKFEGKMII